MLVACHINAVMFYSISFPLLSVVNIVVFTPVSDKHHLLSRFCLHVAASQEGRSKVADFHFYRRPRLICLTPEARRYGVSEHIETLYRLLVRFINYFYRAKNNCREINLYLALIFLCLFEFLSFIFVLRGRRTRDFYLKGASPKSEGRKNAGMDKKNPSAAAWVESLRL